MPDDVLITSASEISWRADSARKKVVLTSSSAISQPMAPPLPAPPAPAPDPDPAPEAVAGVGPFFREPYPVSPGDMDLPGAGFFVSTDTMEFMPGSCADGPDVWFDLEPGPIDFSPYVQSLTLETLWDLNSLPASPHQQSLWFGLATPDRSTVIACGHLGYRSMIGSQAAAMIKLNGVTKLSQMSATLAWQDAGMITNSPLRFVIGPNPFAAAAKAVTAQLYYFGNNSNRWEVWNHDYLVFDMTAADWSALLVLLAGGTLRPVYGVTHRAGGEVMGSNGVQLSGFRVL